jgi:hypothetical protein
MFGRSHKSKIQSAANYKLITRENANSVIQNLLEYDWITCALMQHEYTYIRSRFHNGDYSNGDGEKESEQFVGYLHPIEFLGPIKCYLSFVSEDNNQLPTISIGELLIYGFDSEKEEIICRIFLYDKSKEFIEDAFRSSISSGFDCLHVALRIDAPASKGSLDADYLAKNGYPDQKYQISVINTKKLSRSPLVRQWFIDRIDENVARRSP